MQVFRFDNDGDWLFMRKPWKLSVHCALHRGTEKNAWRDELSLCRNSITIPGKLPVSILLLPAASQKPCFTKVFFICGVSV